LKKIGEMLVENGLLNETDLKAALEKQKKLEHQKPIGEILIEMNLITIDTLIKYLEIQLKNRLLIE